MAWLADNLGHHEVTLSAYKRNKQLDKQAQHGLGCDTRPTTRQLWRVRGRGSRLHVTTHMSHGPWVGLETKASDVRNVDLEVNLI